MLARGIFVVGLVVMVICPHAATQELSLDMVLARAARYVAEFSRQLSGIVAEELYIQEVQSTSEQISRRSQPQSQRLKSDFLLVRPERSDRYVEFRDVFEVNGQPVRDREDRLTRLFLNPETNADQVRAIIDESARHNIGTIPRNVNTPMLSLYFLQRAQQERFAFKRATNRTSANLTGFGAPSAGQASFRVSTEAWVVQFKERRHGTVIRTAEGRDFPAEGRFWIDPTSGAVLMTELVMDGPDVRAVIDVSYQSEPLLGFKVPVEMRERYTARSERVDGVARYGKFRQFQVRTDEFIEVPAFPGTKVPLKAPVKQPG